jgi:protein-S-isoprenylcysteine O-methyltransferase Ste14
VLFVGGSAITALRGARRWAAVTALWSAAVTVALAVSALLDREAGWGVLTMVVATTGSVAGALTLWFGRLPMRWFFVGPFAFREASDAPPRRHVRRSLGQLVVFWSLFLLLLPALLAWAERRLRLHWPALRDFDGAWSGAVLFAVASGFGLWSCLSMAVHGQGTPLPAATARTLVVVGPYRHVRNPMAVAGAFQTVGVGLWAGSWLVVVVALAGAVVWHLLIRPAEEADLARRFGEPYERYRATVRCWLPVRRAKQRRPWPAGGARGCR